jgi:hypothetical protein
VTPPLRLGGLVGSIQIVDKGEELWDKEYFVLSKSVMMSSDLMRMA